MTEWEVLAVIAMDAEKVANYYTPITGDKHIGEQVAFSREGYDFNCG